MQIYNQTRFVSEHTMGMDKTGREFLSLVVKGTYDFPQAPWGDLMVSAEQRPLVMADEFTGEPGYSATLWESDFAFRKSRCDVILQGAAYAAGGRPTEQIRVGLKVGNWSKQFDVLGHRQWQPVGPAILATRPHPFIRQPFSYDTAFGGADRLDPDVENPHVFLPNPVGTGWATVRNQSRLAGLALPNTQAADEDVTSPYGSYTPVSFGPISRASPDRLKHGGTYDQNWIDNIFPFLPPDFDERYFQMAPEDQQIPFPEPGTEIIIGNLTPNGREAFRLTETQLPLTVFRGRGKVYDQPTLPDTLLFDTEARQVSLVWRISIPMIRIITEFTEAWIGLPTDAMLRARREGRRYIRDVATAPEGEDA